MEVKKKLLDIVRDKIRFKHMVYAHVIDKMNKGKVSSPLDMF